MNNLFNTQFQATLPTSKKENALSFVLNIRIELIKNLIYICASLTQQYIDNLRFYLFWSMQKRITINQRNRLLHCVHKAKQEVIYFFSLILFH